MRARAAEVSARIERAARRAGRDPAGVKLVAVSKTHPAALVREAAAAAGLRDFGENRVQEAESKADELKEVSGLRWHLIGHLQPNKARKAARLFDLIHSVGLAALAERLERLRRGRARTARVLAQVDLGARLRRAAQPRRSFRRYSKCSGAARACVAGA